MMDSNAVDEFDVEALVAAKSDQLNADDLMGGPITVKILKVKKGKSEEQPMDIHIEGHRPWKPNKGMRRILIDMWGKPSPAWLGRTIRLYREPTVKWAGEESGGIRLAGMSDIRASVTVPVAVSRGVKIRVRIEKIDVPKESAAQPTDTRSPLRILQDELADLAPAEVVTAWADSLEEGKKPTTAAIARGLAKAVRNNDKARASLDAFLSPSEQPSQE